MVPETRCEERVTGVIGRVKVSQQDFPHKTGPYRLLKGRQAADFSRTAGLEEKRFNKCRLQIA